MMTLKTILFDGRFLAPVTFDVKKWEELQIFLILKKSFCASIEDLVYFILLILLSYDTT